MCDLLRLVCDVSAMFTALHAIFPVICLVSFTMREMLSTKCGVTNVLCRVCHMCDLLRLVCDVSAIRL